MNWIITRFPDETMKTTSACRLKLVSLMSVFVDAIVYKSEMISRTSMRLAMSFSAKRISYFRFHQETGNLNDPDNPVNPVEIKN